MRQSMQLKTNFLNKGRLSYTFNSLKNLQNNKSMIAPLNDQSQLKLNNNNNVLNNTIVKSHSETIGAQNQSETVTFQQLETTI